MVAVSNAATFLFLLLSYFYYFLISTTFLFLLSHNCPLAILFDILYVFIKHFYSGLFIAYFIGLRDTTLVFHCFVEGEKHV
jgi:hypothetical protein